MSFKMILPRTLCINTSVIVERFALCLWNIMVCVHTSHHVVFACQLQDMMHDVKAMKQKELHSGREKYKLYARRFLAWIITVYVYMMRILLSVVFVKPEWCAG